ncbi:hypothetical protein ASZ78_008029 [Callipepla squamata]|uniref:Uncharacterized protein n=1 Tax=Callipepla squamata TaxID=9009 RepID=A0A226N5I0_CALSU|nr:hypothetical protein ASZ78_008029 [Callipepla squamata]
MGCCAWSTRQRKTADPNRFANRGGSLLKEEKQRAKLQKTLSKLQEELESRIQAWEQEHEEPFLVKGQQFMEYVTEQWQLYRMEKEKEKQERHLKKSRQIETEMMYGSTPRTPIKRRVLGPHTPGKVRKVNCPCWLNGTSLSTATPNSTIRSAFGSTLFHSPTSRLPPSGGKRELSKASGCDTSSRILNSTTTNAFC